MATHSSVLAWEIPWTEEPEGLQFMELQRVGHNLATKEQSVCMHAKSLQSCLTLCNPMDSSLPGSSVRGILQAHILEWVAMPPFRGPSRPKDRTHDSYVSYIAGRFFITLVVRLSAPWETPNNNNDILLSRFPL